MKKQVKKLWIDALRSRKYKQTQNSLKDKVGYCCLGVLCELHRQEIGKGNYWDDKHSYRLGVRAENSVLPRRVRVWAGLDSREGDVSLPIKLLGQGTLMGLNDDAKKGFAYIATAIEKYL